MTNTALCTKVTCFCKEISVTGLYEQGQDTLYQWSDLLLIL
jgi:hypothetical protein